MYSRQTSGEAGFRVISGLLGFSETKSKSLCEQAGLCGGVTVCPSVSPTDVPDVGVQAHVFGGFLELEAGVGSRQLPATVWMPRQPGDSTLHLIRISADIGDKVLRYTGIQPPLSVVDHISQEPHEYWQLVKVVCSLVNHNQQSRRCRPDRISALNL